MDQQGILTEAEQFESIRNDVRHPANIPAHPDHGVEWQKFQELGRRVHGAGEAVSVLEREPTMRELTGVDPAPAEASRYLPDALAPEGQAFDPEAKRAFIGAARELAMAPAEANALAAQAIKLLGLPEPSPEQRAMELALAEETLHSTWKDQYDAKIERINAAIGRYPRLVEIIEESGLGRSVSFLRRLDALLDAKERRQRIAGYREQYGTEKV